VPISQESGLEPGICGPAAGGRDRPPPRRNGRYGALGFMAQEGAWPEAEALCCVPRAALRLWPGDGGEQHGVSCQCPAIFKVGALTGLAGAC
jgi:hypothetical protein